VKIQAPLRINDADLAWKTCIAEAWIEAVAFPHATCHTNATNFSHALAACEP
jgi:hypothetical protein